MKRYTKTVMGATVTVEDATDEVIEALQKAVERGLDAIGMSAERHAKEILTRVVYTGDKPYPLTGRLRNSVTFATKTHPGQTIDYDTHTKAEKQEVVQVTEEDAAYLGTNVGYAEGIETGDRRRAGAVHFLKKACTDYGEEYKGLMKDSVENV